MMDINSTQDHTTQQIKNIVLIGFMGSGKTVVGRCLARMMDFEFVDTDEEIEDVTGLPIARLLKKYGETRFRSEEELVLKKLLKRSGLIIAIGGNLNMENRNLELLKEGSFFVLLKAEPEVLYQRLRRKNTRPLLGGNPTIDRVKQLLSERENRYELLADYFLNTSDVTVDEAAEMIIKEYNKNILLEDEEGVSEFRSNRENKI